MATNYDFLNLPKSKPGSSTAYGESLLAGKIKRSEEKAKSAEKFGKILTGLKVGVKGAKWWMDEKIDDFHRGNSTVYANLQGLLDSSANILTQNQEIIKSGKSYEDYFYSKAYTDISAEYARGGKEPIGDAEIQKIAREKAKLMDVEWTSLVKSAQNVPTNIDNYKEQARITQNIPDSPAGWFRNKIKGSLKGETTETIAAKSQAITLDTIQGTLFDNVRDFKTQLQLWNGSDNPSEQNQATKIASAIAKANKAVSNVNHKTGTAVEVKSETGMLQKIRSDTFVITYTDGSYQAIPSTVTLGENDPDQLLDSSYINAIGDFFLPEGTEAFFKAVSEYPKSLAKMSKAELDTIFTEIAKVPEYRRMIIEYTTPDKLSWKALQNIISKIAPKGYDLNDEEDRAEYAEKVYLAFGSTHMIDVLNETLPEDMEKDDFMKMINALILSDLPPL